MKSLPSADKELYRSTQWTPTSLHSTGTTTEASHYSALSAKVFARVILIRLQKLTGRVCPESHCGFRRGFLHSKTPGEWQRTADAFVRCIH